MTVHRRKRKTSRCTCGGLARVPVGVGYLGSSSEGLLNESGSGLSGSSHSLPWRLPRVETLKPISVHAAVYPRAFEVRALALVPSVVDSGRLASSRWPISDHRTIGLVVGAGDVAIAYAYYDRQDAFSCQLV
jgi:hypothetical protein